jgi:hypothetical protein
VLHFPVALADHVRGNLGRGCLYADVAEYGAYQTITNYPYTHIDGELLLVSRMDYTMRIFFRPLVLDVNIDDTATNSACLNGCTDPH